MKNKKIKNSPKKQTDLLSELMEREGVDEMGLLDLVFIEEILNQKIEAAEALDDHMLGSCPSASH